MPKYDPVSEPEHYLAHPSGIEPIEITKYETYLRGNVIKYVFRAPYKGNELQDLKKARQYLDWEIERVENALAKQEKVKSEIVYHREPVIGTPENQ